MRVMKIGITSLGVLLLSTLQADAALMLISEWGTSNIHQWNTQTNASTLYHTVLSNDVDYNVQEGSTDVWFAEHSFDDFGRFADGSGSGFDAQYSTPYPYPKHITVFDNSVFVMSRNDGTIHRYDLAGNEIDSVVTGYAIGQGMATNGVDLFVSVSTVGLSASSTSTFLRFNSDLVLQETYSNPTGLAVNNIYDFAYDQGTSTFFGLATTGESGTGTNSNTIVQFTMGGSALSSSTIGFNADGIGQYTSEVPEPGSILAMLSLVSFGAGAVVVRRRKAKKLVA